MNEPRTIREARLAIREAEKAVGRIHMAPATALAFGLDWYLRKARLALRQAEIHAAKADDPRLDPLPSLPAQIRQRRPQTGPKRKRHRCSTCFEEALLYDSQVEYVSERHRCPGTFELVARLPKGAA